MAEGTWGMSGACEGRGKARGTRKRLIGDRAVIPGRSLASFLRIACASAATASLRVLHHCDDEERPAPLRWSDKERNAVHREPAWCASTRTLERYQRKIKRARVSKRARPKRRGGLSGSVEGMTERERKRERERVRGADDKERKKKREAGR